MVGFSDGAVTGIDMALHPPCRVRRLFAMGGNMNVAGGIFTSSADPVIPAHVDQAERWCRAQYQAQSPTPWNWPQFKSRTEHLWATQPSFTQAHRA